MNRIIITLAIFLFCTSLYPQDTIDSTADSLGTVIDSTSFDLWEDFTIKGFVDKDSLPENDTLLFTVQIELVGNPDQYEFYTVDPPEVSHLNLVSTATRNRSEAKGGKTYMYKEFLFYYEPISLGMAYINPVSLKYKHLALDRMRTLNTARLSVTVTEPVFPKERSILPIIIVIVLAGCAGAAILIWVYLKNKKSKTSSEEDTRLIEEELLQDLKASKQLLNSDDIPEYFSTISHLTRQFISETFQVEALGIPTVDLIVKLKEMECDENMIEKVKKTLSVCDMVKFAKHTPSELEKDEVYMNLEMILTESLKRKAEVSEEEQE